MLLSARMVPGGKLEQMKALNIFEVIRKTTSRIEPFHSRFLGEALCVSAKGDRSLFDAVWGLAAPKGWDTPRNPTIKNEKGTDGDTKGGRRIDITIHDKERDRLLGIEVKTTGASAKEGQLEGYLEGLSAQCGYDKKDQGRIAIAYLTPFNRERAGDDADSLSTVKIFEKFQKVHENARHVSWLDIADIPWDGNELWRQHQDYVREKISSRNTLESIVSRDRIFDSFFSPEAVANFWAVLPEGEKQADGSIRIDLESLENDAPTLLVKAFAILIEDDEKISRNASRKNDVSIALIGKFLGSEHAAVHRALFDLTRQYSHVWWKGTTDYGLRVASKDHPSSGVSLVRSKGESSLHIGESR